MGTSGSAALPRAARPPVFAKAKFLAPQPRATLVPRRHLVNRIQAADALPLTIVVGSPGSGKTSLLADWYRHADDGSVAWLSADRADEDPTRFWHAFVAAVQQVDSSFGQEAADMMTLDGSVSPDVLESLANDDAELGDRIRLVIDDFHLVSLQAAEQIQHLLERGLGQLRLLIGSRSDPAVGLHRLRLDHQVAELREADLRLSLDETSSLVAALGLEPGGVDVAALHDRTEGWAAGVQMATLSVVGSEDPAARLSALAGTTQTIGGYLTAEVMANQTPRVQRFLEHICVVDELDSRLAEALHPDEAGAEGQRVTLEEIESANLMLTRVDSAGSAFRFHQLFAEMLRNRLLARDPQLFREQHRLAADHFLSRGDLPNTIRHYWLAGMSDRCAQVIREQVVQLFLDNSTPPPIDLTLMPPDEALQAAPGAAAGYGVGLILNGHVGAAIALLERAEFIAVRDGAPASDLVHLAAGRVAAHFTWGDARQALVCTERLLQLLADHPVPMGDDWVGTAIPLGIRAAVWEGDFELADRLVHEIRSHHDQRLMKIDNGGVLAWLELKRGDVDLALTLANEAHEAAAQLGADGSSVDAVIRVLIGSALLEQARVAAAAAEFRAGLQTSSSERIPALVLATVGESRILRAEGDFEGAIRALTRLRSRLRVMAPGPTFISRVDHAEFAVRLAMGDLDGAETVLDSLVADGRALLARAWVAHFRGRRSEVDALRSQLNGWARTRRTLLDLSLLDLRVAVDRELPAAAAAAERVLDVAEPGGLMLLIAETGGTVLHAVSQAARRRPRTPYIDRLLALQPLPRPADQARPRHQVDELSNRELIVLRYMVTSMTNQEIAEALYLSVNTVKTHIKHILRKLEATSRSDAARRAHELHYL